MSLTQNQQDALNAVATQLKIPAIWLSNVIQKESGWNPLAVGKIPYNQYALNKGTETIPHYAKGLIQFIDSTARKLGYNDSQDLIDQHPSIEDQLVYPVYNYFLREAPFTDENDFYLSVFYPTYRHKPLDTIVSASVQAANPKIKTVGDYINYIKGVVSTDKFYLMGIAALLICGAYIISKFLK